MGVAKLSVKDKSLVNSTLDNSYMNRYGCGLQKQAAPEPKNGVQRKICHQIFIII